MRKQFSSQNGPNDMRESSHFERKMSSSFLRGSGIEGIRHDRSALSLGMLTVFNGQSQYTFSGSFPRIWGQSFLINRRGLGYEGSR